MPRFSLSQTGRSLSPLAFGTWRILDSDPKLTVAEIARLLCQSVDLGLTTIDTAEIYGIYEVEKILGEAIRHEPRLKQQAEWISKAGIYIPCQYHPERRVAFYNTTAERLIKSCQKSLKWLGLETLDVFLVHRPDWFTPAEETARGLAAIVEQGLARTVGVSNYTPGQFRALQANLPFPLIANQVEFHWLHLDPMFDGTFDLAQETRHIPMAWSPTAGGRIFDTGSDLHRRVKPLAERWNVGLDTLAHAWILAHPARPISVLGTTREERLKQAAHAMDFPLNREQWYELTEAIRNAPIP